MSQSCEPQNPVQNSSHRHSRGSSFERKDKHRQLSGFRTKKAVKKQEHLGLFWYIFMISCSLSSKVVNCGWETAVRSINPIGEPTN